MNTVTKVLAVFLSCAFVMFVSTCCTQDNRVFAEVETGVDVGQKAAPFTLMSVDGKELDLESFAKDKVTLLVFSATWCPACRQEMPIIMEYYSEMKKDGLQILNIDIQESEKKVKSFVEKNRINYPVALDTNAKAAMLYKVVGIPLNVVLDKNGVIVYKENKPPDKEFLEKLL